MNKVLGHVVADSESATTFTEDTAKKMAKYPQTKFTTGAELANKRWNRSDAGDTVSPASFAEDTAKKMNVFDIFVLTTKTNY